MVRTISLLATGGELRHGTVIEALEKAPSSGWDNRPHKAVVENEFSSTVVESNHRINVMHKHTDVHTERQRIRETNSWRNFQYTSGQTQVPFQGYQHTMKVPTSIVYYY